MGIRSGPNASETGANYVMSVKSTPPALREVGLRPKTGGRSALQKRRRLLRGLPRGEPALRSCIDHVWRLWMRPGTFGEPDFRRTHGQQKRLGSESQSGLVPRLRHCEPRRVVPDVSIDSG